MSFRVHRVLFSLLLLILVGILIGGCVAVPPTADPIADETDRSTSRSSVPRGTEDDRLPEDSSASMMPPVPEHEQEEPALSLSEDDDLPPDESDAANTLEPWTAPTSIAPDRPDAEQRRSIAAWIQARPLRISDLSSWARETRVRSVSGAQDLLYRSYLNQLFADAGIDFDQGAAESAITLSVIPEFRSDNSDRNAYGATTLIVILQLEGPGIPRIAPGMEAEPALTDADPMTAVRAELHGPLVLSRVSHEDAHLNSLRRIDPVAVRRAIDTLRRELADLIADRGVPFSVALINDQSDDDLYRVLRSLGVPDEQTHIWRLFDSPEYIRQDIAALLDGSSYRFLLNPLTREIRFLYNEES